MTAEEQQFLDEMRAEIKAALAPVRERLDGHDTALHEHELAITSNTERHDDNDDRWATHVNAANGRARMVESILEIVTDMQEKQIALIADVARHEIELSPWRELWSSVSRVYQSRGRLAKSLMWLVGFLYAAGQAYTIWNAIAKGVMP